MKNSKETWSNDCKKRKSCDDDDNDNGEQEQDNDEQDNQDNDDQDVSSTDDTESKEVACFKMLKTDSNDADQENFVAGFSLSSQQEFGAERPGTFVNKKNF